MKYFIFLLLILTSLSGYSQTETENILLTPKLIAVQTTNIDSAINWYTNNLHFKLNDRQEYVEYGITIAYLTNNGLELELVKNQSTISKDSLLSSIDKDINITGFTKINFTVDNIELVNYNLKSNSVQFIQELKLSNRFKNKRYLIVKDFEGNWIQITEK